MGRFLRTALLIAIVGLLMLCSCGRMMSSGFDDSDDGADYGNDYGDEYGYDSENGYVDDGLDEYDTQADDDSDGAYNGITSDEVGYDDHFGGSADADGPGEDGDNGGWSDSVDSDGGSAGDGTTSLEETTGDGAFDNVSDVTDGGYVNFLERRGQGQCEKMVGKIVILDVFVDGEGCVWPEDEKSGVIVNHRSQMEQMAALALGYGAHMETEIVAVNAFLDASASAGSVLADKDGIMQSAGYADYESALASVKASLGADECVAVFNYYTVGRAYAYASREGDSGIELAVLYKGDYALAHEIAHVFGAVDYYYPLAVRDVADRMFGGVLMMDSSRLVVDSFTAYLVGWVEYLDPSAEEFLNSVKTVTYEELNEEYAEETYTGYVENRDLGIGVYTGEVEVGVPNGYGCLTYITGRVYTGEFAWGEHHGVGTMQYLDGSSYTGEWNKGMRDGNGTFIGADGHVYVGGFSNGLKSGYGECTWPDGRVYKGEWFGDYMHGYGTLTYPDGTVVSGAWLYGQQTGG